MFKMVKQMIKFKTIAQCEQIFISENSNKLSVVQFAWSQSKIAF